MDYQYAELNVMMCMLDHWGLVYLNRRGPGPLGRLRAGRVVPGGERLHARGHGEITGALPRVAGPVSNDGCISIDN